MPFDRRHLYIVATRNYLDTVPETQDVNIREEAIRNLGSLGKNEYGETIPNFIVFDPSINAVRKLEDQRRTLRIPYVGLPAKVYVKLDDYGSAEELSRHVGYKVNTQFVVTFMMAEDY